jgi:nitric oxide reductase subunit B
MMGVYGMLSVGLALFCQRYMMPESRWLLSTIRAVRSNIGRRHMLVTLAR